GAARSALACSGASASTPRTTAATWRPDAKNADLRLPMTDSPLQEDRCAFRIDDPVCGTASDASAGNRLMNRVSETRNASLRLLEGASKGTVALSRTGSQSRHCDFSIREFRSAGMR